VVNAPSPTALTQALSAANEAVTEYSIREGVNPAFALLVGSVPTGLANSKSDIDVFLVTLDNPGGAAGGELYANQFTIGDKRVDIETWTIGEFGRTIARIVDALRVGQSRVHALGEMRSPDFDFLSRVVSAVPVIGEGFYSSWVTANLPREGEYEQVLSARFALEAAATLEDAEGFAEAGNLDGLGFSCSRATNFAVKSWVAATGDVYFVDKYAFTQAVRQGMPTEQLARARRFGQYEWIRESDPQFLEFQTFLQDFLIASQILSNRFPVDRSTTRPTFRSNHMPIQIADGVLLNEEGKNHVLLSVVAAKVWQALITGDEASVPPADADLIRPQLEAAGVIERV
jgi:hypothetical protein